MAGEDSPIEEEGHRGAIVSYATFEHTIKLVEGRAIFATKLKVGITQEAVSVNESYINPLYWGNIRFAAYQYKIAVDFEKVDLGLKIQKIIWPDLYPYRVTID